ncbi:MAG: hypothetical protein IPQ10_14700 [Saprospiraceae bacterium]|nr:hypothetical protein [Saprospiraceae bacterium]
MKNINWSFTTLSINRNDLRNALTDIALEAKANLAADNFIAILDKGYHNGREIQQCKDANIIYNRCTLEIVNSNTQPNHTRIRSSGFHL